MTSSPSDYGGLKSNRVEGKHEDDKNEYQRGRERERGRKGEKESEIDAKQLPICSEQETDSDESRGGVLDVEYVWRMWRTSYTPSGLLWGHTGFWYVISEIPVYLCVACCPCTLFQLEQAGRTVRRESGITSTGVWAQVGEPEHSPSASSNIWRMKLHEFYDEKIN